MSNMCVMNINLGATLLEFPLQLLSEIINKLHKNVHTDACIYICALVYTRRQEIRNASESI